MKIKIKTLRGTHFEIDVKPEDTVADVKKNIETVQGPTVYPAAQQMLIHQGEFLKDATTLEENKVAENSFFVIMLRKSTNSASRLSTTSSATNVAQPSPASQSAPSVTPSEPATQSICAPISFLVPSLDSRVKTNEYVAAASNLFAGSSFENIIQQIIETGGGRWERETVIRALLVAFNDPVRAIDYLYSGIPEEAEVPPEAQYLVGCLAMNPPASSLQPVAPAVSPNANALNLFPQGIPEQAEVPPVAQSLVGEQAMNPPASSPQPVAPAVGPNVNPLNLFPQGLPNTGSSSSANTLDLLRNCPRFQSFRAIVQDDPEILQRVLQCIARNNPNVVRWIHEHQTDLLRLINEPLAGERNLSRQIQLTGRVPDSFSLTLEEYRALGRLEAMGYDLSLALEVFLACNKNEVVAAFFIFDYINDFGDRFDDIIR